MPGDRVAVYTDATLESVVTLVASAATGFVTVPIDEDEEEPVVRPRKASGSKGKRKSNNSSSPPWLAIGLAGGAVVIVAVVGIVLMSGKNDPAQVAQPAPPANATPGTPTTPPSTSVPTTTEAAAKVPVTVAWSVTVDPPPQPIEWPENWKGKIDVYGGPDDALFPTTPSPIFADLEGSTEVRSCQVWDLVTGQKLGSKQRRGR